MMQLTSSLTIDYAPNVIALTVSVSAVLRVRWRGANQHKVKLKAAYMALLESMFHVNVIQVSYDGFLSSSVLMLAVVVTVLELLL